MAISLFSDIVADLHTATKPNIFHITENYREFGKQAQATMLGLKGFVMRGGKIARLKVRVKIHVKDSSPISGYRYYSNLTAQSVDKALDECIRIANEVYNTWNVKVRASKMGKNRKFESGEGYNEALRILKANHFKDVR